jgi:very-short-patch-repair endonuclease
MTNNLNSSDFHLPYNPKLVERAKELRKNMTPAEKNYGVSISETSNFGF